VFMVNDAAPRAKEAGSRRRRTRRVPERCAGEPDISARATRSDLLNQYESLNKAGHKGAAAATRGACYKS